MRRLLLLLSLQLFYSAALLLLPFPVSAQAPDFQCIGQTVASYMDVVVSGVEAAGLNHIKLLSPAFNTGAGDGSFPIIWNSMRNSGINFDQLYNTGQIAGIAINVYNTSSNNITGYINQARATIGNTLPLYITETGMYNNTNPSDPTARAAAMDQLRTELQTVNFYSQVRAALLFDSLIRDTTQPPDPMTPGNTSLTNPDPAYRYNWMTDAEITSVCGGSCSSKMGLNSASFYTAPGEFYTRAQGGWTLEIANNDTNPLLPSVYPGLLAAHNAGKTPIIRIGVGNVSGGFDTPSDYVDFLTRVDNLVNFDVYAIAGPNEPNAEYWASTQCSGTVPTPRPAQNPRDDFPDPLMYPCDDTTNPEFHPLRPYPASPCDPLIPRKNPEASFTGGDDRWLTFTCGKSLNAKGDISGFPSSYSCAEYNNRPLWPGHAAADPNEIYRCSNVLCTDPTATFPAPLCAVRRIPFNVSVSLSTAEFPIIGNTQDSLDDATKVNHYLDWYLNGTIQQTEQIDLDPYSLDDMRRLVNYSGPLKKLLAKDTLDRVHTTLTLDPPVFRQIHNSIVDDPSRLRDAWPAIFKNIPLAGLEDIVGELTVSIIPLQQAGNTDPASNITTPRLQPGEGIVYPETDPANPSAITLTITNPSDSRLYFPHLRNSSALSDLLAATVRPAPSRVNPSDRNLLTTQIDQYQGRPPDVANGDGTPIQPEYGEGAYSPSTLTRNTEVIEGQPAPPPLFNTHDQICDLGDVRVNPGDDLYGSTVNATLTYSQGFSYTPAIQPPIPPSCGGGDLADCTNLSDPTGQTGDFDRCCDLLVTRCEDIDFGAGYDWRCTGPITGSSDLSFPTEARVATFVKTPAIEHIYQTLVAGQQSVLRRFAPWYPSPAPGQQDLTIRQGPLTLPAAADAVYTGSAGTATATHPNSPGNVSITAGNETSGGRVYFGRVGSLFEYFLGSGSDNFNLQKMLRPQGFGSGPLSNAPAAPSTCGAITSLPALPPADPLCNSNTGSVCRKDFSSPLLQQIFESAASFYNVPVSVLVGIFYSEGSLNQPWTDARVLAASGPNCIDTTTCANVSWSGAAGPWAFLNSTWNQLGTSVLTAGVNDGRTPNRCNIIDATFAAAHALSIGRSGANYRDPAGTPIYTCAGVTYNRGIGASTSCNWTASDVVTASRQYLGYCEGEPPFNSTMSCARLGTPTPPFCDAYFGVPYCSVTNACCTSASNCYQRRVLNIANCTSSVSP